MDGQSKRGSRDGGCCVQGEGITSGEDERRGVLASKNSGRIQLAAAWKRRSGRKKVDCRERVWVGSV